MKFSKVDEFVTAEGLPSLPGQILNILDELGRTSAMDYTVLQKIQYDPAIALSVLKAANSPLYGYASRISSLQQAAGLLGPGAIRNIVLTTPILERYQDNGGLHSPLDHSRLWLHMTVTAALASGNGYAIVPGNINKSQLVRRILSDDKDFRMKIRGSRDALKAFTAAMGKSDGKAKRYEKTVKKLGSTFRHTVVTLGLLKDALRTVWRVSGGLVKGIVDVNAEFERLNILLKGMSKAVT
ncbi:MAG: HDOD domain-containing protein, partial [Nitrospinae bacterium]|nr:HDOD domain-containing protein [Nitrospinota bacterium]